MISVIKIVCCVQNKFQKKKNKKIKKFSIIDNLETLSEYCKLREEFSLRLVK